nr:HAMP domain-containing histidine kinase [Chloroflexota bacterium]
GQTRAQNVVRRLATNLGGEVRVVGIDGTILAAFGHQPAGEVARYESTITRNGQAIARLEADLPSLVGNRGFLPLFNLSLFIGGVVSAAVIAFASIFVASRLTDPLRDVGDAARRLRDGELGARVSGGGDRESADLAASFNAMAERLERSEMLRQRAASDIAHDLATPATVLVTQLQAMVDGLVPADPDNLETARSAASALGSVVAELNDLASAEAAPLHARPTVVDLAAAIHEAESALDGLSRERGIRVRSSVQPGLMVRCDPGHLSRVLRNVVTNAIGHSPDRGEVSIEADTVRASLSSPAEVAIRITDAGGGIPAAEVAHVFERFYQADTARGVDRRTGRRPGTGIGLTIARELLAASGGRIGVERTGPDGTTFLIVLPGTGDGGEPQR